MTTSRLLLALLAGVFLAVVAESAAKPVAPSDMAAFNCEACSAFAREYEKRINEKATDQHPEVLNKWARGNASNWRWDSQRKELMSRESRRGVEVIDLIYEALDHRVLTHRAVEITLHAVHTAAHRHRPAKAPWPFVWQVLCVETTKVCEADPRKFGDGSFELLRHDYETFKHRYEKPYRQMYDDAHGRRVHNKLADANDPDHPRHSDPLLTTRPTPSQQQQNSPPGEDGATSHDDL